MDSKLVTKYLNSKKVKPKSHKKIITKFLVSIIFLLISIILIKASPEAKSFYETKIFKDSINFTKFNQLYNKYFGEYLKTYPTETQSVFNETISYSNIENYLSGKVLTVSDSYIVPVITSGIIVYLGEKESLGNTCIVQGVDGTDIWYSNIVLDNLNLYDYVNKGSKLAPTLSNKLYLTLEKDSKYIDYETYQS